MDERNISMKIFTRSLILLFFSVIALLPLTAQNVSYIQIAHNCAQPTLDTVDLYFSGTDQNGPFIAEDSNVVYHSATGYIQILTGTTLTISFNKKHSNGNPADSIYITQSFVINNSNERVALIFSGVDSNGFSPNPGLSIKEVANLDSIALDTSHIYLDTAFVSLRIFQGVTDLPAIKIVNLYGSPLFTNSIQYGDTTADIILRHGVYNFQVTSADGTQNYGTFYADLSDLGGVPAILLCSGFLNPAVNDSGPAFGLYLLENTGAVYSLPLETAGFQILQNCADPAADSLDIYINNKLIFPKLGFRNATQAFFINAHAICNIGIAPKNSTSVTDTFWNEEFNFPRDTFYIATISGLRSQTGFAPNPDGISTNFQVLLKTPAELQGSSLTNFDFFMLNGVTDAPPLNLSATGGPTLLTNVTYTDQTNYVSLPSEFYTLNVMDTSGNDLSSGFANFLAFPGQSAILLTSGFYNPVANNNGAPMNLYLMPITGGPFIPIFNAAGINDITTSTGLQVFPNPASNELHISFELTQPQSVTLQITDLNGNIVSEPITATTLNGTQHIVADLSSLAQGVYFSRLITATGTSNSRFVVVR